MDADTGLKAVLPTQELLLHGCTFGLGRNRIFRASAVHLAERVTASDKRNGLFVVHRHAAEGLTYVDTRSDWIWVAVRAFGVHVNETHLDGAQWLHQLAVTAVALVVEPAGLGAPVDLFGFPHVRAAAGEAEGCEAHGLEGHVAGQD